MSTPLELWQAKNLSPDAKKHLGRLSLEWQMFTERRKAAILSERLANFVLHKGATKPGSVWYSWNIRNPSGDYILLQVADVNERGRDLAAILRGGNQNDRLEIFLHMLSTDFSANSIWSLPEKRLDWLRASPKLNATYPDWYTWFQFPPMLGDDKPTQLKALQNYVKFSQVISDAVFNAKPLQLEKEDH